MRVWFGAMALALAIVTSAGAQTTVAPTAQQVHDAEAARFGFGSLRPGANGTPGKPDSANTDEAKVGRYGLPPLFSSSHTPTVEEWAARRAELMRLVEDNWVGRVPENVSSFKITWRKKPVAGPAGTTAEHWTGAVTAPDGRSGPVVDATITFPAEAQHVPALIDYTYMWPGGRTPNFPGPPAPDSVALALKHGFAYVAYRPQMLQSDSGATMQQGVIGLARWPRAKTDWGALRAWAWGASQLREELARDPRMNGNRISLVGHSRFGKAVLVAAAFDLAFADADVSSSGAGGAKLMRRDFGERWENLTAASEFHWFTPNAMAYAAANKTVADLPVDAHMLIALRAPRPLFVTSGVPAKGDSWVDPRGMWLAVRVAQPAWALFGSPVPNDPMPEAGHADDAPYKLGWYQHTEGHLPWPGYEQFYAHEARFAADAVSVRYRDPIKAHRPRRGMA